MRARADGSYSDLLTMTAFSSLLFNTLTVVGLFVLRRTRPELPRPYRTWGYPVVPAFFVAVSAFFLVFILKAIRATPVSGSRSRRSAFPLTHGSSARGGPIAAPR
jgi:amino acid transporter